MNRTLPKKSTIDESKAIDRGALRTDYGSDPRIVIRGESTSFYSSEEQETRSGLSSIIDFLGFTFFNRGEILRGIPLKDVLVRIFNIPYRDWAKTNAGWYGYKHRINLDFYGLIAWGGTSQSNTIHVELSGKGCAQVPDWRVVHEWFDMTESRITRIDLAHDDLLGEVVTIAEAIKWYEEGLFTTSGRPPRRHLRDDFDSGEGKTFYVGKRGNNKYARIYEKGKKEGDPMSPWCRVEVELRSNARLIPHDILLDSDAYLAGAYPALEYLAQFPTSIESVDQERSIALHEAIAWGQTACGRLVNLLCILSNEDTDTVIKQLRRSGIPKKLEPQFKRQLQELGLI